MAVVINEIHYNPADNTSLEEFVELHNTGPAAVIFRAGRSPTVSPTRFLNGTQIPAGGYVVVAQDPATLLAEVRRHGRRRLQRRIQQRRREPGAARRSGASR